MTSLRLGLRFGKWTLIPLGLTLLISMIQFIVERAESSGSETHNFNNFDRFILINTSGILLTLLLEVLKRWSAEERIIKLTNHLDTGSPMFQSVVNLIEDIDDVIRGSKQLSDDFRDDESNPLILELQVSLAQHAERLRLLKEKKIETEYTNSRLTNRLTEVADRVLGVSDPATDLAFWNSPEGVSSWQAQVSSNAMKRAEYELRADVLPRYGICRIFVLPREIERGRLDGFLDVIVSQVRDGVIASVLMGGQHQSYEGAVFGDLAFRTTAMIGVGESKKNVYNFDSNAVNQQIQHFQTLWNSAWRVSPGSADKRSTYSKQDLVELLKNKGFHLV